MSKDTTGPRPWPIRVVLHGHKEVQVDRPVEVTEFVSEVVVEHGVTPPWDTMQITLQLPKHLFCDVLPGSRAVSGAHGVFQRRIQTGSWVVVSIEDYNTAHSPVAIGFGYVQDIDFGLQVLAGIGPTGPRGTAPLVLQCVSWLTAAGGSNIRVANETSAAEEGFIYNFSDWQGVIANVLQDAGNSSLGDALQKLWSKTSWMIPPDTLLPSGTSTFGDHVPVVFNRATAERWGSGRSQEMLPVSGLYLTCMPSISPTATLAQWLFTAFNPDAGVVELFPSLEYPPTFTDKGGNARAPTNAESPAGADGSAPDPRTGTGTSFGGEGNYNLTPLGAALGGAQPVIIYRHKPFLLHALNQANADRDSYRVGGETRKTAAEEAGLYQEPLQPLPSFGGPMTARRYTVLREELLSLSPVNVSDSRRVNLVYAKNFLVGDAAVRMYDHAGNAVMPSKADLGRYGLRAFEPTWPYIISRDMAAGRQSGASDSSVAAFSALNELFYALVGNGESYANVTLEMYCRPRMKAGHWFKLHISEDKGNNDLMQHMTGYIERVRHTFSRQGTLWKTSTKITASRCTFSNVENDYRTPIAAGVRTQSTNTDQQQGEPAPTTGGKGTLRIWDMSNWTELRLAYMRQATSLKVTMPGKVLDLPKKDKKGNPLPRKLEELHPLVTPTFSVKIAQTLDIAVVVTGRWEKGGVVVTRKYEIKQGDQSVVLVPDTGRAWWEISAVEVSKGATGAATLYAVKMPTPWSAVTRAGDYKLRFVVVHHTGGPYGGGVLKAWADRSAGAHCAIAADGTVYQYSNPDVEKADSAPTTKAGAGAASYFGNTSVSFDFEGNCNNQPPTPAQIDAAKMLVAYWKGKYGMVGGGIASPPATTQSGKSSTKEDTISVAEALAGVSNDPYLKAQGQLTAPVFLLGHNRSYAGDVCPGRHVDVPALATGDPPAKVDVSVITAATANTKAEILTRLFPKAMAADVLAVTSAPVGGV